MSKFDSMDAAEVEENLFAACDAKLHGGMFKQLSMIVCKILEIFPVLEAGRPRSKSGIQALCSLHVALDKAKNLLQHCSECSKLYLIQLFAMNILHPSLHDCVAKSQAITGESIQMKFERVKSALLESLKRVEEIVPQAVGCQIMEMVGVLDRTVFALDQLEKQVGDDVIALIQKERKFKSNSNDGSELEIFHQAALKLGITSSRAALTERRALKKLIERTRVEEDKRKESIVAFLLHLMRKYSKLFRTDMADDTDSQGSGPCSPTLSCEANDKVFEKQFSRLSSFNFKQNGLKSGNMPLLPEEFRCPISLQIMYDPVIISSGQTYERVCIEKWFKDGHSTCPKTQQQLSHLSLTPNYCVKGLIGSWCEQNGVPFPDGPPESLDLNYWRLALTEREATDSRSMGSVNSYQLKEVKVVPLEESCTLEELERDEMGTVDNSSFHDTDQERDEMGTVDNSSFQDDEADEYRRYETLLAVLCDGQSWRKQCKAVEQIRFLLKDDEEARIHMGANGFVEALVQFLRSAIDIEDGEAEEAGAMALFNLAVNNNRNKAMLLSGGLIPLLEKMISSSRTCEPAAALVLNLSCFDEAKPIIGSSDALPFLVRLLHPESPQSASCKHDALHAVFNLSTHPPNIPFLLAADIIGILNSLLAGCTWTEKVLAVFINLVSNPDAKRKMIAAPEFVSSLAVVLDTGEPLEQEQAVACLLVLCSSDERCSHMVLQEGVIPALVSLTVNGTARGREKAQKLLKLFREQRQREQLPVRQQEQQHRERDESVEVVPEAKPVCKSKPSRRLGKTISSLWKGNKSFSVHQC